MYNNCSSPVVAIKKHLKVVPDLRTMLWRISYQGWYLKPFSILRGRVFGFGTTVVANTCPSYKSINSQYLKYFRSRLKFGYKIDWYVIATDNLWHDLFISRPREYWNFICPLH